MLTDRITCLVSVKRYLPYNTVYSGHNTQQLTTLKISVKEVSYLQF